MECGVGTFCNVCNVTLTLAKNLRGLGFRWLNVAFYCWRLVKVVHYYYYEWCTHDVTVSSSTGMHLVTSIQCVLLYGQIYYTSPSTKFWMKTLSEKVKQFHFYLQQHRRIGSLSNPFSVLNILTGFYDAFFRCWYFISSNENV